MLHIRDTQPACQGSIPETLIVHIRIEVADIKAADIHFRVTTEMKDRLVCEAARSGQSLSQYCEQICMHALNDEREIKLKPVRDVEKDQAENLERQQRKSTISARVTLTEYNEICHHAESAGVSVSEYLRYAAMQKNIVTIIDGREMQRQLSKIGGNLNQLTILARMGRITCPDIGFVQRTLGDILKELIKMKRKK